MCQRPEDSLDKCINHNYHAMKEMIYVKMSIFSGIDSRRFANDEHNYVGFQQDMMFENFKAVWRIS